MLRRLLQTVQIDRLPRHQRCVRNPPPLSRIKSPEYRTAGKARLLAASPIFIGTKNQGNQPLPANDVSTNQTLITIPFTNDITLTDVTKLRLFGYADNPLSPHLGQVEKNGEYHQRQR